jgi:hypothetical protein
MRYILEVNKKVSPEALQVLLERERGLETKDTIVTAGQRLIEQGRKEGRKEGVQGLLLRQLRQQFGDQVDTYVEQHIATASVEQIETWCFDSVFLSMLKAPQFGLERSCLSRAELLR